MRGLVYGNYVLVNGEIWTLGCACTSPRRRKSKVEVTEDLLDKLKRYGKDTEIR